MKNKILVNIKNIAEIANYKKVGVSTFLFALKGYCVGYENEFTLDEINSIDEENKYILINRVLDCNSVDELKIVLNANLNIKGIIYEDVAVYQIAKELGLNVEMICFQNHFNSNSETVNFWLNRVDSVVLCNELTKDEIINICNNAKKEVAIQVYGYNQAMYSRRKLLSNFCEEFSFEKKDSTILTEKVTGIKFRALENEYGTVLYSGNIYNGLEMLNTDNVKLYYVNTTFINHDDIIKVLETLSSEEKDDGFLRKETIYKLKGDK